MSICLRTAGRLFHSFGLTIPNVAVGPPDNTSPHNAAVDDLL